MTRPRLEILLARTFFGRFFENDLMPTGIAQTRLVFSAFAVLTAPMYLLTFMCLLKYERIHTFAPARLPMAMLLDQATFVIVSMIGVGAVALISWDGVFPDRRDARTFGVLPLATRTLVMGRLGALGGLAALFAIAPNVITGVLYGPLLWSYGGAAGPLRGLAAHVIATSRAGMFVFFVITGLQGMLLAVFGRALAHRLALLLQTLFVIVLAQALLFLPYLRGRVRAALGPPPSETLPLPPAWFLSLYDFIGGTDPVVPTWWALLAVGATAAAVGSTVLLIALSYDRLSRQALEAPGGGPSRAWRGLARPGLVASLFSRRPVARAVAMFTLQTLRRNRSHLMLLSTYGGFAAAIVVSTLIPLLAIQGAAVFSRPGVSLLSIPLVFNFFLLVGARVVFGIPTEIKANWLFRLHLSDDDAASAVGGARTALLAGIVLAIAVLTAAAGIVLWDVRTGAIAGAFTLFAGWLLAELLVLEWRSVPFTRIYTPGHWRVRGLWPLYVLALSLYAYSLAALALAALDDTRVLAAFAGVVCAVSIALGVRRRHVLRVAPGLSFAAEEVDAMFAGFGLSESIAAAPPRPSVPPPAPGAPRR